MVECCYAVSFVLTTEWRTLAIYDEWHYAECHYAECRGAVYTLAAVCQTWCDLTNTLKVHLHRR
jgi:hypothetical protein